MHKNGRFCFAVVSLVAAFLLAGCGSYVGSDDHVVDVAEHVQSKYSETMESIAEQERPTATAGDTGELWSELLAFELHSDFTKKSYTGENDEPYWRKEVWNYPHSIYKGRYTHPEDTLRQIREQFPGNGWTECEALVDSWETISGTGGNREGAWSDGQNTILVTFNESQSYGIMTVLYVQTGSRCSTSTPGDRK